MIGIKTGRRLLLGLNVALGLGIAAFAFKYLLYPPPIDRLQEIRIIDPSATPPRDPASRPDESVLSKLRNPLTLESRSPSPSPFQGFTLKGAIPALAPRQGFAFLRAALRPADLTASTGEEILQDGKPAPEFRDWRLSEVWKDGAVFINFQGGRCELRIESALSSAPAQEITRTSRSGEPYRADNYKSQILASSENREVWAMDQAELEWIAQNASLIMDRDLTLVPMPGVGLRIDAVTPGSMCAARGLKAGDVIREVDGRPIQSLNDLRVLLNDASPRPKPALRLTLERTGKAFVLEFHPLPR